jgi:hypothetical protein
MRGITKALVAATVAAAVAAVPAGANPMPEPEDSGAALWIPVLVVGGAAAGFATYFLYKRHAASRLSFAGEDVTIKLAPDRAYVTGVYRFYNPGDKTRTLKLRYPFARGPKVGEPENISVRGGGEEIPFSWKRHGVAFEVEVPARGEAAVTVSFEQPCSGCEYTYILTSTRNWGRPIDEARFAVVVPVQLAPVDCSYEWEEAPAAEGLARYEFSREDFYPDVDLVVHWERPDFYFGSTALEGEPEAPAAVTP